MRKLIAVLIIALCISFGNNLETTAAEEKTVYIMEVTT